MIRYMTLNEIESTAKKNGFDFIAHSNNFDFGNSTDRAIFPEEYKSIIAKQHELIDEGGTFDQFLNGLNVGYSIKNKFEDMFYGKPLFPLAIKSGAIINFYKVKLLLEASNRDFDKQDEIVNQFYAQLIMASIQGIFRDLHTSFLVAQNGKESKNTNSKHLYEDCYLPMMNAVRFEINTDSGVMPSIIEKLNNCAKVFGKNMSPKQADETYKQVSHFCHSIISSST